MPDEAPNELTTPPVVSTFATSLERNILKQIPTPDAGLSALLILAALVIGVLYVSAIAFAAICSIGVDPEAVLVDAAGVIGVCAFLIALPAFGYAVRTDATSAKTLVRVENEAEQDLAKVQAKAGLPAGSDAGVAALPEGTVPDPTIKPLSVISVEGTDYELISPKDVPPQIFDDLLTEGAKDGHLTPGELMRKLDYVAREPGIGNKPWLFGFHELDEVWKISYGGRRKKGPTLKRLIVQLEGRTRTSP
jgi:hypothetical protein